MIKNKAPIYEHSLDSVNSLIDEIFERKYYTNHGPEDINLEKNLEQRYSGDSVISMANFDIALLIAILALDLDKTKKVLVPGIIDNSIVQCLSFMKLSIQVEDVDENSGLINFKHLIDENISLLFIYNTLGNNKDKAEIYHYAKSLNIPVLFISKHSFGYKDTFEWGEYVDFLEIFDFSNSSVLNGGVGAAIRTNNEFMAEKLRNIRSSYGSRKKVNIPFTGNGRMSEIQAGLIRHSLGKLDLTISRNKAIYIRYKQLFETSDSFNILNLEIFQKKPNYSVVQLKLKPKKNIDLKLINSKLSFLKNPILTLNEMNLTVLNESMNGKCFFNDTLILPVYDGLSYSDQELINLCLKEIVE